MQKPKWQRDWPQAMRVLFVQEAAVLAGQREWVQGFFAQQVPQARLAFAGAVADVAEGEHFDVVIAPTLPWLAELLGRVHTPWVHFLSAGVERIWAMPFDKRALLMTKSSGVHGAPMSEFAIGAMLFFAKQFHRFVAQSAQAQWQRVWLDELTQQHLLVLGAGHIGQMLAQRAKVFGMRTTGTARHVRDLPGFDAVLPLERVQEVLPAVDYVAVCLPFTPETEGLVDAAFLQRLKPGAVLVDISRGGVVRGDAVLQALESGHLKGAALDVFEQEPLPVESPLWRQERLLITPHVSGTTPFYLERALGIFLDNLQCLQRGQEPCTGVDVAAGY